MLSDFADQGLVKMLPGLFVFNPYETRVAQKHV